MSLQNYYLGCPLWGNKDWVGTLFTQKTKPKDYLQQYAQVFNTIEGNNTFYGLPKATTVAHWKESVPADFRFCFKFPRLVTHVHRLQNVRRDVQDFFHRIAPLKEQIGLLFLQLPPTFSPKDLPVLAHFIAKLPPDFNYAVEVRQSDFFDNGVNENRLNNLLQKNNINRSLFDTATLHSIQSDDELILEAQRKKPQMPSRMTATASRPMLRFVGYPTAEPNIEALKKLANGVVKWLAEGRQPFLFMHSPSGNDLYSPQIARRFHELLQATTQAMKLENRIGEMPIWPADLERQNTAKQLDLF